MADKILKPGDTHVSVIPMKLWLSRSMRRIDKKSWVTGIMTASPKYNSRTSLAVREYQRVYKLHVDGIVGPNTWKSLKRTGGIVPPRKFAIISRQTWEAKPPKGEPTHVEWTNTTTTWLHHSVTDAPRPSADLKGLKLLEAEQKHMRKLQGIAFDRGFSDISYSYVVFPSGNIYAGRGKEILGAHTLGHNSDVGIVLPGNYQEDKVTSVQKNSVLALRRHLGVAGGKIKPHSASYPTSCPGKNAKESFGL